MGEKSLDPGVPILSETGLADRVEREKPVIVLFYADWCPFSKAFMPAFRRLSADESTDVVAANLSHPDDPRWEEPGIETVPTVVAFRSGAEVARVEAVAGEGLDGDDYEDFLAEITERVAGV